MRSAQIFRGFIGIFHYIQTFSVSGCYLPQRRLFLFYKVDPAFIKTILLHSALCRVPQGKKRKYLHILRKLQNIMDQRHTILKRCNSDPHAAKSQCIRFQPDIFLGNRHIDLRKCWSDKTFQAICRYQHNRSFCRAAGVRCHFRKRLNFFLIRYHIKFPRLLVARAGCLHTRPQNLHQLFFFHLFVFIPANTDSVKNTVHRSSFSCCHMFVYL